MKIFLILCVVITSSAVTALHEEAQSKTIQFENANDGSGKYVFSFETSNGILRSESGTLVNVGQAEHIEVQGLYSYTGTDGKIVNVYYRANENGYQILQGPPELVPMTISLPPGVTATLLG